MKAKQWGISKKIKIKETRTDKIGQSQECESIPETYENIIDVYI